MSARTALAILVVALVSLGAAFALGWQQHGVRYDRALRSAQHETDSLREELATKVTAVLRDTIRVDSIVERWHRRRVDTLPGRVDTLPGRVDTVPLLTFANTTITALDSARRRCTSVLNDCASTAAALTRRATLAEARASSLEAAKAARSRWQAVKNGACAGSLAFNAFTLLRKD